MFIGTTSKPYAENVNFKELMNAFDEKVYMSFPDYGNMASRAFIIIVLHNSVLYTTYVMVVFTACIIIDT